MKAMLLAAGRGARMGDITTKTPKPLLVAGDKTLIEHHLEKLVAAGITDVVINHAWLGSQIELFLGDGSRYGASIVYSPENPALETAGGIANALPLLQSGVANDEPFAVISADVYCEYSFNRLHSLKQLVENFDLHGYCVLVPNPAHHPEGDFSCQNGLMQLNANEKKLTYSGVGVYRPSMFHSIAKGQYERLVALLNRDVPINLVGAELFAQRWDDVGTPERLAQINQYLSKK
jgi:N-acetyl-alpha-D-muramate 1-phosphate uridylyltransferase